MTEVWRDVKGYEGVYQVSDLGRVKSLARKVHGTKSDYWIPERIRVISPTRDGYIVASLVVNGVRDPRRVHRLVAEAFLDGYSEEIEVHHIDRNPTNNRADNLVCLTHEEHRKRHPGTPIIGEKDGKTIRLESLGEAEKYGFNSAAVSRCAKYAEYPDGHPKKRKYATHKGWTWRYARGE